MKLRTRVLIAGIGGASLGTEILKCLVDADRYDVYGCDISHLAYGHYQQGFTETFIVDRQKYVESIRQICTSKNIRAVIPGGEEPLALLGPLAPDFGHIGVHIAANSPNVISTCSDKQRLFERLQELGLPIPDTVIVRDVNEVRDIPFPCVIKPATGTGGSHFVFLAHSRDDARLYVRYLLENRNTVLIQEYIPLTEGEYTIGVVSLPDGKLVDSIAMRRLFHTKLSVSIETKVGLISSGYSQGLIDEFPKIRAQAERIVTALGSTGPMNVQGRVREGVLAPFEINPRFSASTYLRTIAGFNEIDVYLQYVLFGVKPASLQIRPGYYLRSLSEVFVSKEEGKQ
jgi:carbamoyl-phosphate synthase large subunit